MATSKIIFSALTAIAALGIAINDAPAAVFSASATDVATVKDAGPRTGTSGKTFFNVEGDNNDPPIAAAANASYGIIDVNGGGFGVTNATAISSATLSLVEANAAFSLPGNVDVYLASLSTANIQPTTSSLKYVAGLTPEGVGSDPLLGTLTLLGQVNFPTTGNVNSGTIDTGTLTLSAAAKTFLLTQINTGGTIRLVLAPDAAGVSATWAGVGNTSAAAPLLTINATTGAAPEPASLAVISLGAAGLLIRRRK